MVHGVALVFLFDEVLQEAEQVASGLREDGEGVDCAVGTGADDVVVEHADGGCGGPAPGRADVALLDADDGAREACFEESWGGCLVCSGSGAVEAGDGGALFIVDEDDGVLA